MEFQYQCGILTLFLTFPFTESQTIEDFGETLHLDRSDLEHLRSVFLAVENGDIGKLFFYLLISCTMDLATQTNIVDHFLALQPTKEINFSVAFSHLDYPLIIIKILISNF